MTALLVWVGQMAATPWSGPSLETIVTGFATLAALYLIKLVLQLRDIVTGDGKNPGLVAQMLALASALAAHCKDEREFWDRADQNHRHLVDETQAAVSVSETHLSERIDVLAGYLNLNARTTERKRRHDP